MGAKSMSVLSRRTILVICGILALQMVTTETEANPLVLQAPEQNEIGQTIAEFLENELKRSPESRPQNLSPYIYVGEGDDVSSTKLPTADVGGIQTDDPWIEAAAALTILMVICIASFWCMCYAVYFYIIRARGTK